MSYIYTDIDRLETPHHYMYTKYEGEAFLNAYRDDRLAMLDLVKGFNRTSELIDDGYKSKLFNYCLAEENCPSGLSQGTLLNEVDVNIQRAYEEESLESAELSCMADEIKQFAITKLVETEPLLQALVASQLTKSNLEMTKEWLDRLIQRFEVTKKIYQAYGPGFRKGDGVNNAIRLYWLLSLNLCLYYLKSGNAKYLSTLLKVNDLILSSKKRALTDCFSSATMTLIIRIELLTVAALSKKGQL